LVGIFGEFGEHFPHGVASAYFGLFLGPLDPLQPLDDRVGVETPPLRFIHVGART